MEKLYSRPPGRSVLQAVPWGDQHNPKWSLPADHPWLRAPDALAQQQCRRVPKLLCKVGAHVLIQLAFIEAYFTNIDLLIQARPRDIRT